MVFKVWKESAFQGTASYYLHSKLRHLKSKIKTWTKEVGLKEETRITNLLEELADLDYTEAETGLNVDDRDKRNVLKVELGNRMHWEAISWK